jgi:hypothetical protein
MTVCLVAATSLASAQASLAGVVRDSTGAVLPGVAVLATSPVLIERSRTYVTDDHGRYRIEDLRPGIYSVTFTLAGFIKVSHDGLEVSGSGVITLNATLSVGVEDTITITPETPIVEPQSTIRQTTLVSETLRAIPSARSYGGLVVAIPGVQTDTNNVITGPYLAQFPVHGGRPTEARLHVDGLNVGLPPAGNQPSTYVVDIGSATEVNVVTSGGLGENETGGLVMNVVPNTGGNNPSGQVYFSGFSEGMQADNWRPELGIAEPVPLRKVYDFTLSVGGPIVRDRLWYFAGGTTKGQTRNTVNLYYNLNAGDPNAWSYAPDLNRPAYSDRTWEGINLRLTWQVTSRNKLGVFWDEQAICRTCTGTTAFSGVASPTTSPEADGIGDILPQRVQQMTWSSPLTTHLLLDGGVGTSMFQWGNAERRGNPTRDLIRVTESQALPLGNGVSISNLTYRSQNYSENSTAALTWRAGILRVTGAHSVKVGYEGGWWKGNIHNYVNAQGLSYRFRNGVPDQFTMTISPFEFLNRAQQTSFFVQDQWTRGRLTLAGAARYDRVWSWFPEQRIGPTRFLSEAIVFPAMKGVDAYSDITPRMGLAYDLLGTGQTVVRVSLGKYLEGASSSMFGNFNPVRLLTGGSSASRSWNDNNRDFVIDCAPLNPAAQGPSAAVFAIDTCGPLGNTNFGTTHQTARVDPDLLRGWGVRGSDWALGISVQQQLLRRASVEVAYHRRWFSGFTVTDNLALDAGDFDRFSVVAPADPLLPGGGGYVIENLYDPRSVGVNNLVTLSSKYGNQYRYFNGVDVTFNVRAMRGVTFQGGLSTGESVLDTCEIRNALPEIAPLDPYCHTETGFLTQFRGLAVYTIPGVDLLVSTMYQDKPGSPGLDGSLAATWTAPGTAFLPSLGRPLTSGSQTLTVNLIRPWTLYGDRIRQLDLGLKRRLRFASIQTTLGCDLYNLLNSNVTLTYNNTFTQGVLQPDGSRRTMWLTPTEIMNPRIARVTAELAW